MAAQATNSDHFVPLFELTDPSKVSAIERVWQANGGVAWIQPINFAGLGRQPWADSVQQVFQSLHSTGVQAVPVVTLDEDNETFAVISRISAEQGRGVVLRLDCEDVLEEDPAAFASRVDEVLTALNAKCALMDIVLDAGLVDGGVAVQANAAASALNAIPHLAEWRSLVVAFSAFPALVGEVAARNSVVAIPRSDASAFRALVSKWRQRVLTFADYGVGVPTYSDTPWAPIPNIRYATDNSWVIHRANEKRNPSPQYIQLATQVVASPEYRGPNFSEGDKFLNDVAAGVGGPGNAGSYLRVAMSHHFAVVLDSLATSGAP